MTTFGDPENKEGTTQQAEPTSDKTPVTFGGMTEEQILELKKRDENAQPFIEQLKIEAQQYRDQIAEYELKLKEADSASSIIARMQETQANATNNGESTAPAVDVDKLLDQAEQRVMQSLTERERQVREEQNFAKAAEALTSVFGDNVNQKVQERARALNLPVEEMDRLAKTSPDALVELVRGPVQQRSNTAPTTSSLTGIQQNGEDPVERFARMREENPREYNKPETQAAYRKAILDRAKKNGSQYGNPI